MLISKFSIVQISRAYFTKVVAFDPYRKYIRSGTELLALPQSQCDQYSVQNGHMVYIRKTMDRYDKVIAWEWFYVTI